MITNPHHREILIEIKRKSKLGSGIMDNGRINYQLTQPQSRIIAKKWIQNHRNISLNELLLLLDSLYKGKSHDERVFGGKLLECLPVLRKQIDPGRIMLWLTGAEGWWEVDSLCQIPFASQEILDNWDNWAVLLENLVSDRDIHKRRASLVLLTKAVRESSDERLSKIAFKNIDRLKLEKGILITKAISWLLRDLIKNHRNRVEDYLSNNESSLPKIAIRETKHKLLTGRK